MENTDASAIYAKLKELESVYADAANRKAMQFGLQMRCEFMAGNLSGAKKIAKREGDVIVVRWASHPFASGNVQDFADEINNILAIFTAPNAPVEHKELSAESTVMHEDSALHHANRIVQSGRLRYRKTTQLYVQDILTGLSVTVYSDSLNIWDLQSAAHIKLAAVIEQAKQFSKDHTNV